MLNDRWLQSLLELIKRTSTELPSDVQEALANALDREQDKSRAKKVLQLIMLNCELALAKRQPICQDTGSILFYAKGPVSFDWLGFQEAAKAAVEAATKLGFLRPNSVDPITGMNSGNNLGPGSPIFYIELVREEMIEVRLVLKGGGCENVGIQYSLPYEPLRAMRDLEGCRRVILDAVVRAQGKGCAPGVLGVSIGGDRTSGFEHSKRQFLRTLNDQNQIPILNRLEQRILKEANQLGIGPMGLGGLTTLLGVKIGYLNRLPASYFVTVSYMCWAFRRQGVRLTVNGDIVEWLY